MQKIEIKTRTTQIDAFSCARSHVLLQPDPETDRTQSSLNSLTALWGGEEQMVGSSQFLFLHPRFLSSCLSSTPVGCEGRLQGKKMRTEEFSLMLYLNI